MDSVSQSILADFPANALKIGEIGKWLRKIESFSIPATVFGRGFLFYKYNRGMLLYNKGKLKKRRMELRTASTPQEKLVWSRLRMGKVGFKFRRQFSIGWYIADFYCPKKKLVVEIDGAHHTRNKEYDNERTDYLTMHGITVLRFWDKEVNGGVDEVIQRIIRVLRSPSPLSKGEARRGS